MYKYILVVYIYIFFIHIHSSVDAHLGFSHVPTIVNSATMNTGIHVNYAQYCNNLEKNLKKNIHTYVHMYN